MFKGSVDELRVSSIARSSDWIATEFSNQSSPATFYTLGAEVTYTSGGPGTISSTGLYTAPTTVPAAQDIVVTATRVPDSPRSGTATVRLSTSVAVSVSSPSAMNPSQTR